MSRKKRKTKANLPSGIDSKLELELSKVMTNCEWKPESLNYIIEKTYHPDARYKKTLIEVKGRFRTTDEAKKYIWIRDHLEEGYELVFVFSNPYTAMPRARSRKDGTKRSHADWADKHGFTWYDKHNIPKEWK